VCKGGAGGGVGALVEEKKALREEEEEEKERESWRYLCSAILCGHPNLLENFLPLAQPGCTPTKVVENLL